MSRRLNGQQWRASSSSSRASKTTPRCHCGLRASMFVSRTADNPNRKFYKCGHGSFSSARCGFFCWEEENEEMQSQVGEAHTTVVHQGRPNEDPKLFTAMLSLQAELETMRVEIGKLQDENKGLRLDVGRILQTCDVIRILLCIVPSIVVLLVAISYISKK